MFATMKDLMLNSPSKYPFRINILCEEKMDREKEYYYNVFIFKTKKEATEYYMKLEPSAYAIVLYDRRNGKTIYKKDVA